MGLMTVRVSSGKCQWADVLRQAVLAGLAVVVVMLLAGAAIAAPRFAAVTVDARNGKVLFAEDPDGERYPASLTKMMTLYVLFEDLKAGKIKLASPIRMSRRAASMAPSKLGVKPGSSITVETAIRALVVKSANDVAVAVAETLGGTEQAFARRMTHTARRLGMPRTSFANASGLPNPAQVTTARDMATLGLRLMRDFPQYYPYFRTRSFVFQGRTIKGHNRLLGKFEGTDGIKTGYINASGFNLVSSVRRGDKRLVGVVLGGKTGKSRDAYMRKMLDRQFAKASSGKAIAALAGSPKGAIDPLASAGTATAASPEATVRKPKSSIFGKKKEEPPVSGSQVAEADPAVTEAPTEEGDTDDAPAMGALAEAAQQAAAPGQEEPKSSTAAADPAVLSVPDPANVPFEVKSPEEQAADAKIVATLAVDHSWSIQIGSYASKRDAQARLQEMRRQIGIPLAGKTALTVAVQKNTAVTYRARFTGFSQGEAQSTCDEMAKLKAECQVLAPQS